MSQRQKQLKENPVQISCYTFGVGNGTEGVCLSINVDKYHFLLDCGLSNFDDLLTQHSQAFDFVFCSHAHSDHCRGLQQLSEFFPQLPIYTSHVTAKLLEINYLRKGFHTFHEQIISIPWQTPIQVKDDLIIEFFPSGHLPGAAAIFIKYVTKWKTYKIFYTGDFCISNLQLVEGLSLESLRALSPDILIIEGFYGTTRHPHRKHQEKQLIERIIQAFDAQEKIIFPVPTIGLGQEIIKLLRSHHQFTGKNIDIWIDGDIALACDKYLELIEYLPQNVQNFAQNQSLFWDEKILPRLKRVQNNLHRQEIANSLCIVLTDDINYLKEYSQNENLSSLILLPEHLKVTNNQEFEDLILEWELQREDIKIETYLLAQHSDGKNTTQLIHNLRPQHVILVHGSTNYLADLISLEELQNRYQLHCPSVGTLVELPIGENFVHPVVQPQNTYEGELNETGAFMTISLPEQINKDSRWQNFADTGLIEARWQGEELVLRGVSQRELLQQNNSSRRQLNLESCSNCVYYTNQNCSNPESPLYEFRVTPDGFCPVFENIIT